MGTSRRLRPFGRARFHPSWGRSHRSSPHHNRIKSAGSRIGNRYSVSPRLPKVGRFPSLRFTLRQPSASTLKRAFRAVRIAATDSRIPRPLRWLGALGLAPVPGPFDEVLLLIVAVPLVLFYREPLLEAWREAAE